MSAAPEMLAGRPDLAIVVPTRNERDNVAPLTQRLTHALAGIRWEVIFVDDDSPDGTAAVVRGLCAHDAHVRLLHRIGQRGLASACVAGVRAARAPCIAVMDADLQHDVALLPQMLRQLREPCTDVVVASRYVDGGNAIGLARRRRALSALAVRAARAFPRVRLSDPMSGYFALRREAFEAALPRLSQLGFKILLDVLLSAPRPLRCVEIPCALQARRRGSSKLDTRAVLQFAALLAEKLAGRLLPLSLALFLCVGGSGALVQLSVLAALLALGIPFAVAQALAVLAAMTSNFQLNNLVTYRDLRLRGLGWLRGLLSFYAVCAVGALANVSLAAWLYRASSRWWLAGACGAALGAAWNYLASQRLTWPAARAAWRAAQGGNTPHGSRATRQLASERPAQRYSR